jgi:hypothetical protein
METSSTRDSLYKSVKDGTNYRRSAGLHFFFNSHRWGAGGGVGVHTVSTRRVGHFWPIVPSPGDCEDAKFGGIKIGRGNRSTRRKPAPAPLCPPQVPLEQTRARTRAAAVGSSFSYGAAISRLCPRCFRLSCYVMLWVSSSVDLTIIGFLENAIIFALALCKNAYNARSCSTE